MHARVVKGHVTDCLAADSTGSRRRGAAFASQPRIVEHVKVTTPAMTKIDLISAADFEPEESENPLLRHHLLRDKTG